MREFLKAIFGTPIKWLNRIDKRYSYGPAASAYAIVCTLIAIGMAFIATHPEVTGSTKVLVIIVFSTYFALAFHFAFMAWMSAKTGLWHHRQDDSPKDDS